MAAMDAEDWNRVGRLLRERREAMGLTLMQLAAEHGMSDRTLANMERGVQRNQRPTTIAAIEVAYGLETGAIARALEGGDLVPPRRYEHPYDQAIWELDMPEDMRLALIEACQSEREHQTSQERSQHVS